MSRRRRDEEDRRLEREAAAGRPQRLLHHVLVEEGYGSTRLRALVERWEDRLVGFTGDADSALTEGRANEIIEEEWAQAAACDRFLDVGPGPIVSDGELQRGARSERARLGSEQAFRSQLRDWLEEEGVERAPREVVSRSEHPLMPLWRWMADEIIAGSRDFVDMAFWLRSSIDVADVDTVDYLSFLVLRPLADAMTEPMPTEEGFARFRLIARALDILDVVVGDVQRQAAEDMEDFRRKIWVKRIDVMLDGDYQVIVLSEPRLFEVLPIDEQFEDEYAQRWIPMGSDLEGVERTVSAMRGSGRYEKRVPDDPLQTKIEMLDPIWYVGWASDDPLPAELRGWAEKGAFYVHGPTYALHGAIRAPGDWWPQAGFFGYKGLDETREANMVGGPPEWYVQWERDQERKALRSARRKARIADLEAKVTEAERESSGAKKPRKPRKPRRNAPPVGGGCLAHASNPGNFSGMREIVRRLYYSGKTIPEIEAHFREVLKYPVSKSHIGYELRQSGVYVPPSAYGPSKNPATLRRVDRVEVRWCSMAQDDHDEAVRQYGHTFHHEPPVVCVCREWWDLPRGHRDGVMAHEVGHFLAGPKGSERAADKAFESASGHEIGYRDGRWGERLQWIDAAGSRALKRLVVIDDPGGP